MVPHRSSKFDYLPTEDMQISAEKWAERGVGLSTATELALEGRTVEDFDEDLRLAAHDESVREWELIKATALDAGDRACDFNDRVSSFHVRMDAYLAAHLNGEFDEIDGRNRADSHAVLAISPRVLAFEMRRNVIIRRAHLRAREFLRVIPRQRHTRRGEDAQPIPTVVVRLVVLEV